MLPQLDEFHNRLLKQGLVQAYLVRIDSEVYNNSKWIDSCVMAIPVPIKRLLFLSYMVAMIVVATYAFELFAFLFVIDNPLFYSKVRLSMSTIPHVLNLGKHPAIRDTIQKLYLLLLWGIATWFLFLSVLTGWRKLWVRPPTKT